MPRHPIRSIVLAAILAAFAQSVQGCGEPDSETPETVDVQPDAGQAAVDAIRAVDAGEATGTNKTASVLNLGFVNIAHRGGRKLRPEHTIVAYDHAIEVGADMIEFDLHATSDGVIVAMHDGTVDRTTDGQGTIRKMTWAQLSKLDAGYHFKAADGTFPYRGKGLRVPRLDELLARYTKIPLAVELKQVKPSLADPVLSAFEAAGAVERTVFAAFSDASVAEVRKRNSEAHTALAIGEMVLFAAMSDVDEQTYKPPGRFVQAPIVNTTPELIARAHRLGMFVQPWTVNDAETMKQLIAIGVDGMFTDDPALLEPLTP